MASPTVRVNLNICPEVAEKLEELAKDYGTKREVIEQAITRLYEEKKGDK